MPAPALSVYAPTAVQAFAELHDTLLSRLDFAPEGLGAGWMAHVVPDQDSASATWVPAEVVSVPTAVQALDPAHETAVRTLARAPAGLRVGWTAQLVPFQRYARVTWLA
jgi:hypothetical protein